MEGHAHAGSADAGTEVEAKEADVDGTVPVEAVGGMDDITSTCNRLLNRNLGVSTMIVGCLL